jgi:hypothetical protein
MAQKITNTNFTINVPSVPLNEGEKLIVRFRMENNDIPGSNFTSSIVYIISQPIRNPLLLHLTSMSFQMLLLSLYRLSM